MTLLSWKVMWPVYALAVTPQEQITKYLQQHGAPARRAAIVAQHIVAASDYYDVDPAMVTAIITVENPVLKSKAKSRSGARGLMQVMPLWKSTLSRRCGTRLEDDRTNLCYGITIYRSMLQATGTYRGALEAYHGCLVSKPTCTWYADVVLVRYRSLSRLLASASPEPRPLGAPWLRGGASPFTLSYDYTR